MAYSINTNITSLQAQDYLRVTSDFQAKTINRVTSGLRIISSGDDAAGLAIANTFRSDRAVLTQGVRNANDGLSTLQTIDGGINNISLLLDRARTLAAQSASGLFNGDRSVLNSEFSSLITEIDRQAQAIGLDQGGLFAGALSVFVGGGRVHEGAAASGAITNGSVSVDLTSSTVDAKSLGLTQYAATGAGDLRSTSTTSVEALIAANGDTATFNFYGPGFGDFSTPVQVAVNVTGIVDGSGLVEAINSAIQGTSGSTAALQAFKDSGITASMSADGRYLMFTSGEAAFQVQGGDVTAAALLGALTGTTGVVDSASNRVGSAGVRQVQQDASTSFGWDNMADGTQVITISTTDAAGATHSKAITLTNGTTGASLAAALTHINSELQATNDSELQKIIAVQEGTAAAPTMRFLSTNQSFTVTLGVEGGATANEGIGGAGNQGDIFDSIDNGTAATADISTRSGAEAAVTALAEAVVLLGAAQAQVGKGQNNFTYAVNLAQTQLNNLAASESRIRDADLAAEAANLTKAQILQQAGIAALAQANVAPQAVLTLLRG